MTRPLVPTLLGLAVVGVAAPAHADRRAFTHTYEYTTAPEAETEVELYSQQSRTVLDGASDRGFGLTLEIEHGITDRWDIAVYHTFEQTDGATPAGDVALHFAELELETRYRFSERGEWPVDVELIGEGVKKFGEAANEAEAKLVLARDLGNLTIALNLGGAVEFGAALPEVEAEASFAGGLTYEVLPELELGAEAWGERPFEAEEAGESPALTAYAGPALSWAPATSLWVALTPGFGLTDSADDLQVRLALGLHL